jgi:hypothetical protein
LLRSFLLRIGDYLLANWGIPPPPLPRAKIFIRLDLGLEVPAKILKTNYLRPKYSIQMVYGAIFLETSF